MTHSNHTHTFLFYVVSNECNPILGLPDLMQLGMISFNCRISDNSEGAYGLQYYYKDDYTQFCFNSCEEQQGTVLDKDRLINGSDIRSVFSGVGRFLIWPVDINLSENPVPVQKPAWCVPVSLKRKSEHEIHSMECQGIISKLDRNTTTEWLNSFFIVKKLNGDLRICLDWTDVNNYIVRPVCNSNTLDDISFKLKDAKHFSVFDATKGFFHLPLSDKPKLFSAMLTPIGVYVFNVLAMGLLYANHLFESTHWVLLEGPTGIVNFADDILVFGATQEEYDSNVISFLERCI